jgi:hypothetical protein
VQPLPKPLCSHETATQALTKPLCRCNRGFRGKDCTTECYGGAGYECSRHGICLDDGGCSCELGWVGLACNAECPGMQIASGSVSQSQSMESTAVGLARLPCSGHGTCTRVLLSATNASNTSRLSRTGT